MAVIRRIDDDAVWYASETSAGSLTFIVPDEEEFNAMCLLDAAADKYGSAYIEGVGDRWASNGRPTYYLSRGFV